MAARVENPSFQNVFKMEILQLFRAFETLQSHGFDLNRLLSGGKVQKEGVNGPDFRSCEGEDRLTKSNDATQEGVISEKDDESEEELGLQNSEKDNLLGDIARQKKFLSEEIEEAAKTPREKFAEKEPSEVNLLNLKVSQLLDFKKDVEELYDAETFVNAVGSDISEAIEVVASVLKSKTREGGGQSKEKRKNETMEAPGSAKNPIRVLQGSKETESMQRSFKSILMGENDKTEQGRCLKPFSRPRREGGNVVVELDVEEYRKGVEELKFSIVGRISLQRGQSFPTNKELRGKLEAAWGVSEFQLIPLKGGFYHVIFNSLQGQCMAMSKGAIHTRPGMISFCRWYPGFDPNNFQLTSAQVWIRIHDLPLEFRKDQNISNIAAGIGLPLQIDPLTMNLYHGFFARVLVEVDLLQPLPDRILVKLRDEDLNLDISFFVSISYERMPKFCAECASFSHDSANCKKELRRNFLKEDTGGNGRTMHVKGSERVLSTMLQQQPVSTQQQGARQQQPVSTQQQGARQQQVARQQQPMANQHQVASQQQSLGPSTMHNTEANVAANTEVNQVGTNQTTEVKASETRPWQIKKNRSEKIDKLASNIMAEEALKLITEAYEVVFEGKEKSNVEENKGGMEDVMGENEIVNVEDKTKLNEGGVVGDTLTTEEVKEDQVQADISSATKVRSENNHSPSKTPRWCDQHGEEEEEIERIKPPKLDTSKQSKNASVSEGPSIASQLERLDPDKIYWNEDEEIYVHSSGMCFDPAEKVYFTLINPDEGDLRPLYYRQCKGDFKLAVRGELGQSNKIVLEDSEWDRNTIYTSLSIGYRPNLLALFKEKFKLGRS